MLAMIAIVFVSLGGVFFLAFLAAALFCFLKMKKQKSVQETETIRFDERKKTKEAVVEGPCGKESVVLSIEDDIHIDAKVKKNEDVGYEGSHAKFDDHEANESSSVLSSSSDHENHLVHNG